MIGFDSKVCFFSMQEKIRIRNSESVPPDQCIFCKIISRQVPSNIVFEDETYVVFLDNRPFNRGHTLVCPKKHGETVWDMSEAEIGGLFMLATRVSRAIVRATKTDGFRFVQNNGEAANQVVPHVHVHVIPVKLQDKGQWMDRKILPSEEMKKIAEEIKNEIISLNC